MNKAMVLFEVTLKAGKQADYLSHASALKRMLAQANGCLSAERFTSLSSPNKLLSLSQWRDEASDEASIEAWRNELHHRRSQAAGRNDLFEDDCITVVTPLRCYGMTDRVTAPADSNDVHGL